MRDWTGAVIASITVVAALVINPAVFYDGDIVMTKIVFAGILLSSAGAAFLLAKNIHELSFARHVTFWIVGLAVLAIGATNMDVLTGTTKNSQIATKQPAPIQVGKTPANAEAPDIYVPDTLKINRVERLVTRDDEEQLIKSTSTSEESALAQDRNFSDEEKEKFERFLAKRGVKFDPETAFKRPVDPNAAESSAANNNTATDQNTPTDF